MDRFPNVFKPLDIKHLTLKNRIVFPPAVTSYSNPDGSIGDRQIEFYRTIAQSGVGLVIIGATAISQNSVLMMGCSRIDKEEHVQGLTDVFATIKSEGSIAGIQLAHAGRQTSTRRTGGLPLSAPSAIPCPLYQEMPREMSIEEIREIENAFVRATERALETGADFIEYHAAHGYLLNQFLSPFSNERSDEYGGSLENRARLPLNIIKKARKRVGDKPVLGFRISVKEFVEGGFELEEAKKVCGWMVESGSDFVDVSAGVGSVSWEIRGAEMEKGTYMRLASSVKEVLDVPVIAVGAIKSLEQAERALAQGSADLVAMCRALIADPLLIQKTLENREDEIVECISCRNCVKTINDDDSNGMECSQNPDLP